MAGIKESKEALIALVVLGKLVSERLKDGVQLDDAIAIGQKFADEAFKAKVMAGIEGVDKVKEELQDLNLFDLLELAKALPEILEEIKA